MKLYLAVAVLMLAFVAYTEAQEETIEQKLATFTSQVNDVGRTLAEKAKTALTEFQESEFAKKTTSWFQEQVQKFQNQYQAITQ
ncbi:apolipoprotein C-I [Centropristis striata]|uniref:apolipoprotein C-I n=1 Tax=Centropristis striata TaxID=184440 RepID=UPI0027DF9A8A|nr:apolipoprotein C-I [Centropristis striata]